MNTQNYISQKQLAEKTGLKHSQIDYLVRENIIPCKQYGKAIPRKYPHPEAVNKIQDWKLKRGIK